VLAPKNCERSGRAIGFKSTLLQFQRKRNLADMPHITGLPGSAATEPSRRWRQRDRPILAYGLMLVAAVSLVLNYFIKFPTLPEESAARFREYCDKKLPLQIETSEPTTLGRYFEAEGVPSAVRMLDLATYTLRGGRIQRVLNRKSSWYAYQGPGGKLFVFQVFRGNIGELPAGPEIRSDRGRSFHVYAYARLGATVVFWQEKNLGCVLISDASEEETIRLAQASLKG